MGQHSLLSPRLGQRFQAPLHVKASRQFRQVKHCASVLEALSAMHLQPVGQMQRWAAGALAAVLIAVGPEAGPAHAALASSSRAGGNQTYEAAVQRHKHPTKSNLPSAQEAEAMLYLDRDMFTPQAWSGMAKVMDYARYLETLEDTESAPGCEQCTNNRLLLERVWQVVANEFYSPAGTFDQAEWAEQLLSTVKAFGSLRTKRQAYAAAEHMVASLGDRYSEFLQPTAYRRAIRRPQPAEREYLAAQFTGTGIQVGHKLSPAGGWAVDAVMAESPAEEAGILQGERILEIDGYPAEELNEHEVHELMRGTAGSLVILTMAPAPAGVTTEEGAAKGRRLPSELLPVPLARLTGPSFQPVQLSSLLQPAGLLTGPAAPHLSMASAAAPLAGQGGAGMASDCQRPDAGLQSEANKYGPVADTSAQKLSADPSGKQRQHYAAAYQSTAALQPLKQVLPQEATSLGSLHFTEPGQQPGTRVVYLERRPLPQPPLKQALIGLPDGPTVGYLRLHYFSSEGTTAFTDALRFGEFYGVAGWLIDLRNNPGGVFEEAIATASLLLKDGQEIAETVRTGSFVDNVWRVGTLSKEIFPNLPGQLTDKPIVLLLNGSTASASEVLAGALHDNNRAVTVGEKSFGKGVVQYYFPNKDGSGLKLTVAKYLSPAKYDITQQGGIRPDIACHDYPHGEGRVSAANDSCILAALQEIEQQSRDAARPLE